MKKLNLAIFLVLAASVSAQESAKRDTIEKLNGSVMTGDVTEVLDSIVNFVYTGEKTVYKIKKTEIRKITFASGRVEQYNSISSKIPEDSPGQAMSNTERHNKVAILPFSYVTDIDNSSKESGLRIQDECRDFLVKQVGSYSYADNRQVNVKLAKSGITKDNLDNYTMDELCALLGVEYVLQGTVSINRDGQTSRSTQTTEGNVNGNSGKDRDDKTFSATSTKTSTTEQEYATLVTIKIYNDKGEPIFDDRRKPLLFTGKNAYKGSLEYLLKRTPLYQK